MSSITSQDFFKVLKNAMISLNKSHRIGDFDTEFEDDGVIRLISESCVDFDTEFEDESIARSVEEKCIDLDIEVEINQVSFSVYCFETEMNESVVLNINLDNLDENDVKEKLECAYVELCA